MLRAVRSKRASNSFQQYLASRAAECRRDSVIRDIVWGIAFQRAFRRREIAALSMLIELFPSGFRVMHAQGFRARHRLWQGGAWFESRWCTTAALSGIVARTVHEDRVLKLMRRYDRWKFDCVGSLQDFGTDELFDLFPDIHFLADFHEAGKLEISGQYEQAATRLLRAAEKMPADSRQRPGAIRRAIRLRSNVK